MVWHDAESETVNERVLERKSQEIDDEAAGNYTPTARETKRFGVKDYT